MQFIKLKLLLNYNLIAIFCHFSELYFVVAWCYDMILNFQNRFNHTFSYLIFFLGMADIVLSTNAS